MSTLATLPKRTDLDCRVWERYPCELPTACQPVASRNDKDVVWSGTLRDISVGGVGVVLKRRFEPGMGLAIELPGAEPGLEETLLAKVVYVRRWPEGGWLLGCAFISRLSENELEDLMRLAERLRQPTDDLTSDVPSEPEALPPVVIQRMVFQSEPVGGRVVRLSVRRLVLAGSWPPMPGTVLQINVAGAGADPVASKIRVTRCLEQGGDWTVAYQFVGQPSAGLLRFFGHKTDRR
jgi:hypothetical protein